MTRIPTDWSQNPSSETNQFAYDDSSVLYDSIANNYDGVVDSDMSDRGLSPADWDKVDKTPTSWSKQSKTPTGWVTT